MTVANLRLISHSNLAAARLPNSTLFDVKICGFELITLPTLGAGLDGCVSSGTDLSLASEPTLSRHELDAL